LMGTSRCSFTHPTAAWVLPAYL